MALGALRHAGRQSTGIERHLTERYPAPPERQKLLWERFYIANNADRMRRDALPVVPLDFGN